MKISQVPFGIYMSVSTILDNVRILTVFDRVFLSNQKTFMNDEHQHVRNEVFFLISGQCEISISGNVYLFSAPFLFSVPSGFPHCIRSSSEDSKLVLLRNTLTRLDAKKKTPNANNSFQLLSDFFQGEQPKKLDCCENLLKYIDWLQAEFLNRQPLFNSKIDSITSLFYIDLVRTLQNSSQLKGTDSHRMEPFVTHAFSSEESHANNNTEFYFDIADYYFKTGFSNDLSVNELADMLNISICQTRRIIHKAYGISFSAKLIETRIHVSKNLILETNLKLEEIAAQVGYKSYNGFYEAFRKEIGCTPAQYRRNAR